MKPKPDDDISALWSETGNLGGRLTSVETKVSTLEATSQHWQNNHRIEMNGNFEKFRIEAAERWDKIEEKVLGMIEDVKNDFFAPLLEKVEKIQEHVVPTKTIEGIAGRLARMEYIVYGMVGAGILISQWENIKGFLHG